MRKLYLIVGRCASGKDTIVEAICKKTGWKRIISFTDAPIRADQTDGVEHYFLSKEQFDELLKTQTILAYTQIGQNRYCATMESMDDDTKLYIIDPLGIESLKKNFGKQMEFVTFYIDVPEDVRIRRMEASRPGFDAKARIQSENEQFREFEEKVGWDICVDNTGDVNRAADDIAYMIEILEKA